MRIESFENAIANQVKDLRAEGINPTAFWAYRDSCRSENELIDFHDVIWEEDIVAIADTLKENGIDEFTISCNFSGLIRTLVEFEKAGYHMVGTTEVNATYKAWGADEFAQIPALKMSRI